MKTILGLYRQIEKLDVKAVAVEALKETTDNYEGHQVEQLFDGKKSDGRDITPFYSDYTIAEKKAKGQPYDRVTLADTLKFYEGIHVDVQSDRLIVDSSDSKSPMLQKRYGQKIFGLGGEYKRRYVAEDLRPAFIRKIRLTIK